MYLLGFLIGFIIPFVIINLNNQNKNINDINNIILQQRAEITVINEMILTSSLGLSDINNDIN